MSAGSLRCGIFEIKTIATIILSPILSLDYFALRSEDQEMKSLKDRNCGGGGVNGPGRGTFEERNSCGDERC